MEYLEPLDLVEINQAETGVKGGTVVDLGLVYAAAMRPRAFVAGQDVYPDVEHKAAALLHALVTWHPFAQKNYATAINAAFILCEINGYRVDAEPAELDHLARSVAVGEQGVEQSATTIKTWLRPQD